MSMSDLGCRAGAGYIYILQCSRLGASSHVQCQCQCMSASELAGGGVHALVIGNGGKTRIFTSFSLALPCTPPGQHPTVQNQGADAPLTEAFQQTNYRQRSSLPSLPCCVCVCVRPPASCLCNQLDTSILKQRCKNTSILCPCAFCRVYRHTHTQQTARSMRCTRRKAESVPLRLQTRGQLSQVTPAAQLGMKHGKDRRLTGGK